MFAVAAGLFLPVGFPDTVSPDYLAYQLWAVPSHITGWMGGSLITSSLLAAVGIKAGAGPAAGAAASIRWITKDGIGALGRLLVSKSSSYTYCYIQSHGVCLHLMCPVWLPCMVTQTALTCKEQSGQQIGPL